MSNRREPEEYRASPDASVPPEVLETVAAVKQEQEFSPREQEFSVGEQVPSPGEREFSPREQVLPRSGGEAPPYYPGMPVRGGKSPAAAAAARKKRRRRIRTVILLVVLAGIGFAVFRFFSGRGGGSEMEPLTDVVQYGAITAKVEGSGMTKAKKSETIVLKYGGTIQEIYVEEGDVVQEGDELFYLDSEEARKALDDAEDGVTKAREAVTTAQKGVESARKAVDTAKKGVTEAHESVRTAEEGVTTALEGVETAKEGVAAALEGVETARQGVKDAEQGVVDARQAVKDAEEGVTDAQKHVAETRKAEAEAREDLEEVRAKSAELGVKAPGQGKLLDTVKLNPGDKVSEGDKLATFADDTRFRLSLYFSYAYAELLREGQSVDVSIPVLMTTVPGTVEAIHLINRVTAEGARLFSADIAVPNEGGMTDGMEATVSADIGGETVYPYESGKLAWYHTEDLKAKVSGTVISSGLTDYLPVAAGQVVATLKGDELEKEIEAAEKKVEDAEKTVTDAEKAVETARKGVTTAQKGVETAQKGVETAQKSVETAQKGVASAERGVASAEKAVEDARNTVEDRRNAIADAEQAVKDAEQGVEDALKNVEDNQKAVDDALKKVEDAQADLDKCYVTATVGGTIIGLDVSLGEEVSSGKAAVMVSDTSTLIVNATVDERNIGYVKKGLMVDLDQWGQAQGTGIVESVSLSSTVNNGVATYPMVIAVDNEMSGFQVNSYVRYSLVASQNDNCLVVPVQCVRSVSTEDGESLNVVYVQGETAPDNAVEGVMAGEEIPEGFWPVPVEIGIQDTYNVEIRSGLEEGQTVFTQIASANMW